MADRYFWGTTKMDKVRIRKYIDFDVQAEAPVAKQGRLYVDATGHLLICNDGTSFVYVGDQAA